MCFYPTVPITRLPQQARNRYGIAVRRGSTVPTRSWHFVRQRHRSDILVASVEQLVEPAGRRLGFGEPNHGPRSVNQQRSQIRVAALTDAQQDRFPPA